MNFTQKQNQMVKTEISNCLKSLDKIFKDLAPPEQVFEFILLERLSNARTTLASILSSTLDVENEK